MRGGPHCPVPSADLPDTVTGSWPYNWIRKKESKCGRTDVWERCVFRELHVLLQCCPKEVSHSRVKRGETCASRWDSDFIQRVAEDPLKGVRQVDLYFVKNSLLPVFRRKRGKVGRDWGQHRHESMPGKKWSGPSGVAGRGYYLQTC